MGLDITAYRGLMEVFDPDVDTDGDPIDYENTVQFFPNKYFDVCDGITEDQYFEFQESFTFRVGAYSYYNRWRDKLAQLVGYPELPRDNACGKTVMCLVEGACQASEGPFKELICFSDCEGFLGPQTSLKLYRDFENNFGLKDKFDGWERSTFLSFHHAFRLASLKGAVRFW